MERSQVIERLWQDTPLFLTREEFARSLDGWDIEEVPFQGGTGAVIVSKGPEFHFAVFEPGFQVTREHLRRWPGELIARFGYALTRTPKEDTRQQRFNERLGFVKVGEDEYDVHYKISESRLG